MVTIVIGIILLIGGFSSIIFGIIENNSVANQLAVLVDDLLDDLGAGELADEVVSSNPGTTWIIIGIIAAVLGFIFVVGGAARRKSALEGKKRGSNRLGKWFREMRSELKKVVWPTPKQIVNNTIVSLTVMIAAAILIWAIDQAGGQIFQAIRLLGRR